MGIGSIREPFSLQYLKTAEATRAKTSQKVLTGSGVTEGNGRTLLQVCKAEDGNVS